MNEQEPPSVAAGIGFDSKKDAEQNAEETAGGDDMKKLLENAKNIGQLKARVAKADTNLELVYSCEGDDLQWYQDMIVRKIVGNEETAVTGPDGWGLSDDDIMFSELVVSLLPSTDENTGMIKIKEAVLPRREEVSSPRRAALLRGRFRRPCGLD